MMLKFWNGEDVKIKAQQFISNSIMKVGLALEGQAKLLCPVDEDRLRDSIETKMIKANKVEVETKLEYGIYVEFGTRPHWPPIDVMTEWAGRVLGNKALGFQIARAISRKGTRPQPFMRPAYDIIQGRVLTIAEKEKYVFQEYFKER